MYPDYIMHFNPNHDPRNGQFAKGHGGISSGKSAASGKKLTTNQKAAIGAAGVAAAGVGGIAARLITGNKETRIGLLISSLGTGIRALQMARAIKMQDAADEKRVKKGKKLLGKTLASAGVTAFSDVRAALKAAKKDPNIIVLKPEDVEVLDPYALPMKQH